MHTTVLHGLHGLHAGYMEKTMSTNSIGGIRKIARIHDKATDKYLEVIEFPISAFKVKRIELLPSVINDLKACERRCAMQARSCPRIRPS